MEKMKKFRVSKKEGNRTLGRLWHRQGDIIKMDLKYMCVSEYGCYFSSCK